MKPTILILALILAGDDGDDQKPVKEQDQIQGTWAVTALHVGGPVAENGGSQFLNFEGDKMFATWKGRRAPKGLIYELDPTKSPRTIDFKLDAELKGDAESKGDAKEVYQGIYEFDGPRLRICYHSKTRPTKFESEKQTGEPFNVLYELERK